MKILLGLNNSWGSNVWAARFINSAPEHSYRIAAFYRNHEPLPYIDWCLDALKVSSGFNQPKVHELFGRGNLPYLDLKKISFVFDDLIEWEPDLVISDCENITANIAKTLGIPLWYCSPMLLLIAVDWPKKQFKYLRHFYQLKSDLKSLPEAQKYLVYSFFGDIPQAPLLKPQYEWISPYSSINEEKISSDPKIVESNGCRHLIELAGDKFRLTSGETSFISDSLFNEKIPIVVSNQLDNEQAINAELVQHYHLGFNAQGVQDNDVLAEKILEKLESREIRINKTLNLKLNERLKL